MTSLPSIDVKKRYIVKTEELLNVGRFSHAAPTRARVPPLVSHFSLLTSHFLAPCPPKDGLAVASSLLCPLPFARRPLPLPALTRQPFNDPALSCMMLLECASLTAA